MLLQLGRRARDVGGPDRLVRVLCPFARRVQDRFGRDLAGVFLGNELPRLGERGLGDSRGIGAHVWAPMFTPS